MPETKLQKLPETKIHQVLVKKIIEHLEKEDDNQSIGYLEVDDGTNSTVPSPVGSYRPDVYATIKENGLKYWIICEVRTSMDPASVKQLKAFAEHVQDEVATRLVVAAPQELLEKIVMVLRKSTDKPAKIHIEPASDDMPEYILVTLEGMSYDDFFAAIDFDG